MACRHRRLALADAVWKVAWRAESDALQRVELRNPDSRLCPSGSEAGDEKNEGNGRIYLLKRL